MEEPAVRSIARQYVGGSSKYSMCRYVLTWQGGGLQRDMSGRECMRCEYVSRVDDGVALR